MALSIDARGSNVAYYRAMRDLQERQRVRNLLRGSEGGSNSSLRVIRINRTPADRSGLLDTPDHAAPPITVFEEKPGQ